MSSIYATKDFAPRLQLSLVSSKFIPQTICSHTTKDGLMLDTLKKATMLALIPCFLGCGKNLDTKNGKLLPDGTTAFSVTAANAPTSYTINGIENPQIKMRRGTTYSFNVRTLGNPFYILIAANPNPANAYSNGVSGN